MAMRLPNVIVVVISLTLHCIHVHSAENVKVNLYIEALCPFCAKFTSETLAEIFKNGIAEIADIRLIPYGNARVDDKVVSSIPRPVLADNLKGGECLIPHNGEVACQHGPNECKLNRVLACAVSIKPKQADWFPFAKCLEGKYPDELAAVDSCAKDAGIDVGTLSSCVDGSQGDALIKSAAQETNSLQPAHKYVPWVVVNDVPLGANYGAIASVICASYLGTKQYAVEQSLDPLNVASSGNA